MKDLLNLPERMEVRLTAIDDALVVLDSGIAEVSVELSDLANRADAGELNMEQVASAIRARGQALSDLRPDTPVVEDPAAGEAA